MQFIKLLFNIVKVLFKSIERPCRSEKKQLGFKAEEIIFQGGLRKKYLTSCQILRSKDYLYTVQQEVFSNIMKVLLKSIDCLCRSGKLQLGSKAEKIIVLGILRKEFLTRCQILRSKDYLYTVQQKVFSNIVKVLFKSIERLRRSGKMQIGSKAEIIIVLGILRKKYLTRCQILLSKDYLYTVSQKVFFNIVKVFFKSIERLYRSGKEQIDSKAEGIIVLGSLRKKYLTRCQILRSKDYLHTV